MTTEKKSTLLLFMNIGLAVALVVFVLVIIRDIRSLGHKKVVERPAVAALDVEAAPPVYALQNDTSNVSPEAPKNLIDVFSRYPQSDVGDNAAERWKAVSPEDKAKLVGLMDKTIEKSKATLEIDPNNKKAKKLLFISESLKKQILNNFEYSLEDRTKKESPVMEKK